VLIWVTIRPVTATSRITMIVAAARARRPDRFVLRRDAARRLRRLENGYPDRRRRPW
jgi:hypothetical protein